MTTLHELQSAVRRPLLLGRRITVEELYLIADSRNPADVWPHERAVLDSIIDGIQQPSLPAGFVCQDHDGLG